MDKPHTSADPPAGGNLGRMRAVLANPPAPRPGLDQRERKLILQRLQGEQQVSVDDLAQYGHVTLPGEGSHPVSPVALTRWIVKGLRGVKLDGFHRPGVGWVTSLQALDRFAAAVPPRERPAESPRVRRDQLFAPLARHDLEQLVVGLWAMVQTLTAPPPDMAPTAC